MAKPEFVSQVLTWWEESRAPRDALPWRQTRDPWLVLVSEFMLAQTQVARVIEPFGVLAARFPTAASCAAASPGEVLRRWVGLGYNRRAVALHRAATIIVERHGGVVPSTLADLLALPGVGPYTARAVMAFAHGGVTGVVDTNIGRVLARAVAGRALSSKQAQLLADDLTPPAKARDWNLALMDFGSLVCAARSPRCHVCPLVDSSCAWKTGMLGPDPAVGSAAVTQRQSAFEGSDRQGRGRLVKAACEGPISATATADIAGWPDDSERAERVLKALVREGVLAETATGTFCLS